MALSFSNWNREMEGRLESHILSGAIAIWVWGKIRPPGPCFHLPGFHLGYLFLTHSQMARFREALHMVFGFGNPEMARLFVGSP